MKKPAVNPAISKKLVKFLKAGGSTGLVGTIIGSMDEKVLAAYLDRLKATDPDLYKNSGLGDEDDPTADLEDEEEAPPPPPRTKTKETTAGLDSLFTVASDTDPATPIVVMTIGGKEYPMKFRLRGPDGLDRELEVFSKNPRWGVIVRIPVPSDMRKIFIPGGEVEVDLLVLKRDPDGMTLLNGKKFSNSKLIAVAELQEEDE